MQIDLSIIFPFSSVTRLRITKSLFTGGNCNRNSRYALLFYVVIFIFVFFPLFIKTAEAVPLAKTLQVMDESIFSLFMLMEHIQERSVKADFFPLETAFDKMDKWLLKVKIFFFKFLSFDFDFVIPNCNEGGQQNSNNGEGNNKMLTDGVNNEIQESHFVQAIKGLGLGFLISIVFKIVWHVVNYIYA